MRARRQRERFTLSLARHSDVETRLVRDRGVWSVETLAVGRRCARCALLARTLGSIKAQAAPLSSAARLSLSRLRSSAL